MLSTKGSTVVLEVSLFFCIFPGLCLGDDLIPGGLLGGSLRFDDGDGKGATGSSLRTVVVAAGTFPFKAALCWRNDCVLAMVYCCKKIKARSGLKRLGKGKTRLMQRQSQARQVDRRLALGWSRGKSLPCKSLIWC